MATSRPHVRKSGHDSRKNGEVRPHDLGITVSAEEEDVLSGQVWDHRPLGIRIESGPDGASRLTASFASRTAAEACAAALGRPAEVRPSPSVDWEAVNAGLPQVEVGSHALRISPGLVFGWGGHPSTRLLLDALAAEPPSGLHVLDAGCGSGVLSVAAAALGAAAVTAVDVDPVAVEVTGENRGATASGNGSRPPRRRSAAWRPAMGWSWRTCCSGISSRPRPTSIGSPRATSRSAASSPTRSTPCAPRSGAGGCATPHSSTGGPH